MKKLKLRGKELKRLGYPEGKAMSVAMQIIHANFRRSEKEKALEALKDILQDTEKYSKHEWYGPIVEALEQQKKSILQPKEYTPVSLLPGKDYISYGINGIEASAIHQMDMAMRLPVTVKGALMADAHEGYGLPIGGVLATKDAVIPYGVGMDIGCRMYMSVYNIPTSYIEGSKAKLMNILNECTAFGKSVGVEGVKDHEIMERKEFNEIKIVRENKKTAYKQLGSSGSGNHFVDMGIIEIEADNYFHVPEGRYLGVLSHSGSRRLGAAIATYYTQVAKGKCPLPKGAQNLAWLGLDTSEGQEYWSAMNLAGDYAKACHEIIHKKISKSLAEKPIIEVQNHHNFAWKEELHDGTEVIVHRKGATPAQKGILGVIPGSMTTPAYIVKGKGNQDSIYSAAHGAGRKMSRSKAKQSFTHKDLRQALDKARVTLIGGGMDEVPMAYKDIQEVMKYQKDLVEQLAVFYPKIVKMSGD